MNKITLPTTGHTVILRSFVSQDLHEKLELLGASLLGMDTGEAIRLRLLSVEQIGDELGNDRMMEIQNAEDEHQRNVLLEQARAEIIGMRLNLNSSVDGTHKLSRARTAGMIESVTDKDGIPLECDSWDKWLGSLPNTDYKLLDQSAEQIVTEQEERMGKASALSSESSLASTSAAQKTKQEAGSKS